MNDYIDIKLLLLGDSGIGKTTFLKKITGYGFLRKSELTIGVDYATKIMDINNKKIKVHIWDTAGQESFRAITKSYFRSSHCALIFFDLTNIDSINNIDYWIKEYKNISTNDDNTIMLIGNKKDSCRVMTYYECIQMSKSYNIEYNEISVLNNTDEELLYIITKLLNKIDIKEISTRLKINLIQDKKIKKCFPCS